MTKTMKYDSLTNAEKDDKFKEAFKKKLGIDEIKEEHKSEMEKFVDEYKFDVEDDAKAPEGSVEVPTEKKEEGSKDSAGTPTEKKEADSEEKKLNVDGEEKSGEGEGMGNIWKPWAEEKGYQYEDVEPKPENTDYACTIYKTPEDKAANKPLVRVQASGDNVAISSSELEVYEHLVEKAKENHYTSINFMEHLSPEQQKLLMIACLEHGMKYKGNTPEYIGLDDPVCAKLSGELKAKINKYNIDTMTKKRQDEKAKNPGTPFDMGEMAEQSDCYRTTALIAAKRAGLDMVKDIKYENAKFLKHEYGTEKNPVVQYLGNKDAKDTANVLITGYNLQLGQALAKYAKEAIEKGNGVTAKDEKDAKAAEYEISEQDPMKRAVIWATLKKDGKDNISFNPPLKEPVVNDEVHEAAECLPSLMKTLNDEYENKTTAPKEKVEEKTKTRDTTHGAGGKPGGKSR